MSGKTQIVRIGPVHFQPLEWELERVSGEKFGVITERETSEAERDAVILKAKEWTAPTYVDGTIYARNSQVSGGTAEIVCLKPQ